MKFTKTDKELNCIEKCIILSDDTKVYRHLCDECPDCDDTYEKEWFTDELGDKIETPDLTDAKECVEKKVKCKKSSILYTVIDNAGLRFSWNALIEVTLTDDSVVTVNHLPQTGWNNSLLHLVDLFTGVLTQKCGQFTAEVRFNPRPFTLTDFTGLTAPNGLLFPPTEIAGSIPNMGWRYLQINACPTCVSIKRAKIISVNGNPFERDLPLSFVPGVENRYDLCQDCAEEGTLYYQGTSDVVGEADKPVCLFDCAENIPDAPEAGCNFTILEGCDNLADGSTQEIFIQYADCGTGELVNAIYVLDTDGGLVDYEVQGTIDDCNGNNIEPPEVETPFYTTPVCVTKDGVKTNALLINDDGKEIFVTGEGTIVPDSHTIGYCKKGECEPCCTAIVSTFRGGITDPRTNSFTSSNFTGADWNEFVTNGESLGYTITLTSIGSGNTSLLTICGENETNSISYNNGSVITVELECEKCEAELVTLCPNDLEQLTPIEETPDKDYIVVCDEEGNSFLQCINNATGEVSTIDYNGQAASENCEEVTVNCTTVPETRFSDTLTSITVGTASTSVPTNWTTLSIADRISFFESLLPATATYSEGRVCNETSFTISFFYGRRGTRSLWTITTTTVCTGTEPIGELGACDDDYTVEDEIVCSSIAGTLIKLLIFNGGTLETELYLDATGNTVTDLGIVTIGECKEECKTSCGDSISGYDITEALGSCSKISFIDNNAFTSICRPANWTAQDLVDRLNSNNPTGTVFEVLEGNVIGVVSGEAPESINFTSVDISIFPTTTGEENCAYQVKDCNSDRNIELLQEIADNTCPNNSVSNVVCSSIEQSATLSNNTTVTLTAGQELILGQIFDCKSNIQSFSISTLVGGELFEVTNAIETGECPETVPTIPLGCIKDASGVKWNVFETTLNGETVIYYQNEVTSVVGTPEGEQSTWTSCTETCGSFTGIIKCFESSIEPLVFTDAEGTIAVRTVTVNGVNSIDWTLQTANAAEVSTTTYIENCLAAGTNPTVTLVTNQANTYSFTIFGITTDGGTTTPDYTVSSSLVIPPIQTIQTATISCGTEFVSGKASQWKSCDLLTTKWIDCDGNELDQSTIDILEDCGNSITKKYTSSLVCLDVEGNKTSVFQVLEITNTNGVISSRVFYVDLLGNEVTGTLTGGCNIPSRTMCSSVFGNITEITVNSTVSYYGSNGLEITTPLGTLTVGECNTCCPVVVENCAKVNTGIETIQYGIYPDTGIHVGWYTVASTQQILTEEPQWVDCCDSITEICI